MAAGSVRAAQQSETDHMRLGLRMEQRASLKGMIRILKQRLDIASSDLQVQISRLLICFSIFAEHEARTNF